METFHKAPSGSLYRKKPVVIEAIQLKKDTIQDVDLFINGMLTPERHENWFKYDAEAHERGGIIIKTLEGNMFAQWDDWIIKGVNGEFYPCKPNIFDLTYEKV